MMPAKTSLWLILLWLLVACQPGQAEHEYAAREGLSSSAVAIDNAAITQAYQAKLSDVQVSGKGIVTKLLNDDNKGARHQKFLLRINAQQTLLFAHNIDLAARVPLQIGDEISFYGEYVYNPKGGIIHWTHHAPAGDHVAGWILHQGKKYQ